MPLQFVGGVRIVSNASRPEFFARAARRYLDDLSSRSLTRQIDDALEAEGVDDSNSAEVNAGGRRLASQADS